MHIEVGSCEAQTNLTELLRRVQAGNSYTITLRGEPIAELVPVKGNRSADAIEAVEQMLAFMRSAVFAPDTDIKALVDEGRAR
jgi:prevent-host-death family protein